MRSEMLTIKEVAEFFGVSQRTVRRYIEMGEVKAYRLGPRLIRIPVSELSTMPVSSEDSGAFHVVNAAWGNKVTR